MNLFERIPTELFSVLASPNRALYADALDVLWEAYRDNLKIPEHVLYSMLRSKLEQQLADAAAAGDRARDVQDQISKLDEFHQNLTRIVDQCYDAAIH